MLVAGAQVVTSASAGVEAVFRELVARERERAVGIAYHLTGGDRELAKDVAQDAFVRAYRALPGFRGEAQLSTWFIRILIRQASSARRREAVRRRFAALVGRDEREVESSAITPDRVAASHAARQRIARALDRLPQGQRTTFALVHLEGMTIEEAARILGKAPGTLKSHLHRALVALRRELADLKEEGHERAQ